MEPAIVAVKRAGDVTIRDFELPTDMPIEQVVAGLAQALGWDLSPAGLLVSYDVEAHPPGRKLRPDETLAQAQVWDGTLLILHPRYSTHTPVQQGGYVLTPVG